MKNVMVVGNSNEALNIFSRLLIRNIGTCIHESSIFSAIKTVYGRRIDAIIISSRELVETKLNFLSFIRDRFSEIRVMIAFDNGLGDLNDVPEGIEIIMSNGIDNIIF